MSLPTIISALIGAIIGISVSGTFGRLTTALRLNRIRKVIVLYSISHGKEKSEKYCEDMYVVKNYIDTFKSQAYSDYKLKNYGFDVMPMLTSDIFKNFTHENLLRVCYNNHNYIKIVDIIYSIDFIKENMPLELSRKFQTRIKAHLKNQVDNEGKELDHLKDCAFIIELINNHSINIQHKITRAIALKEEFESINKNLGGHNLFWIAKYIFRQ